MYVVYKYVYSNTSKNKDIIEDIHAALSMYLYVI